MDVTVTMTAEEFLEFMAWRKDKNHYRSEMDTWNRKWKMYGKVPGSKISFPGSNRRDSSRRAGCDSQSRRWRNHGSGT